MPLNINDSINNLLTNMTQEHVDIWCENEREKNMSVEEFVKVFNDYSKDGLVSLMTAFSMSNKSENEEKDIEKAEVDKLGRYYTLIYARLKSNGFSDDEIEERIIEKVLNSKDIDTLLRAEVQRIKENPSSSIRKSKVYLNPGEQPPNDEQLMRGPKGGLFYEGSSNPQTLEFNIDEEQLENSGYADVSNGNSTASIEERSIDDDTADKYFDGETFIYSIGTIESKISRTGSATDLVNQIKNWANSKGRPIILTPDAKQYQGFSGQATKTPLTQQQLENWYKKLGFNKIIEGEEAGSMYWIPMNK